MIIPQPCLRVAFDCKRGPAGVFLVSLMHLGSRMKQAPSMSFSYLWLSLALGCAIPVWLWNEAGLNGRLVLTVGMPGAAIMARALCKYGRGVNRIALCGARSDCGIDAQAT